jgi:hypothetical protein
VPLILAENDATESGHQYADRTGISYEFPRVYERKLRSGDQFIYYRGRKRQGTGRQPQVYFGTGIIGNVYPVNENSTRLQCEIKDFQRFIFPVPFRTASGRYLEFNGVRRGYFQQGVRRITNEEFEDILVLGALNRASANLVGPASSGALRENRDTAIARMATTAARTALLAKGQVITVKKKRKRLLASIEDLQNHIHQLLDQQHNSCAITGLPLQFGDSITDPAMLCSLDRIDSSGHYEIGNLQIVCRFINRWKGATNDQEFRRLLSILRSTPVA